MKLNKKKTLAAKVLGVGKGRIQFSRDNFSEIKEAISRQDIKDLKESGAISVREPRGRRKVTSRKHRRRTGKIKKKVSVKKKDYVILIKKLRVYLRHLLKTSSIDKKRYIKARKMIRAGRFRSKRHLKESLEDI